MDGPTGQVPHQEVFENEETATSAVTTLYSKLRDEVLLTGNQSGMNILMGYYTDELNYYSYAGMLGDAFYRHTITATDGSVQSIWNGAYNLIYMSNSAIEGIDASQNLSPEVKNQLIGETLFIRALTHFYLINLFGDVPYVTTTDYLTNKQVSRMPTTEVYQRIIKDLSDAKAQLTTTYVSTERTRANRYVVSAFLARVYLYTEQWQKAEEESSSLINASSVFYLENDLNKEFLKESTSAILQFKPKRAGDNTLEGGSFIFNAGPPLVVGLNPDLLNAFEPGDQRKQMWIGEVTDGNEVWYFPYKYKQQENTGTSMEYSIVLRLAEQYLIRAEALVHLDDLSGARQDINVIRHRAGLANTNAVSSQEMLDAILKERRLELFTEQGHRWFDLKRLGKANEVLSYIKPNWRPTDVLFPIPESELLINPKLAPQNPGY
ncbi:membrane protein [Empedobacter brevis NBRC 14943 = ATCC 43319]|uniref:Membrane protein n=1 Tax=Empedobacter brevis NBRC 14943 = ATCC 43319 TaxID=1218108 RepID=A0A511NIU6_9FLAO|nr:membrane protein [Empedobacter brevis NBRC 14943 = ATCC 43319]